MKSKVDTPSEKSWYQLVNEPGFSQPRKKPQRVILRTISAEEARELRPILHGNGTNR